MLSPEERILTFTTLFSDKPRAASPLQCSDLPVGNLVWWSDQRPVTGIQNIVTAYKYTHRNTHSNAQTYSTALIHDWFWRLKLYQHHSPSRRWLKEVMSKGVSRLWGYLMSLAHGPGHRQPWNTLWTVVSVPLCTWQVTVLETVYWHQFLRNKDPLLLVLLKTEPLWMWWVCKAAEVTYGNCWEVNVRKTRDNRLVMFRL